MDKKSNSHSFRRGKKRTKKPQSNKLVDRLTFNPKKHKQKEKRNLRQQLQQKVIPTEKKKTTSTSLKFGSFNINGLDLETSWAVGELLETRSFDVRKILKYNNK